MPHCNMSATLESEVRKDFKARWVGWLETYQPGLGGGMGVPDTQIMTAPNHLVPIELKRGLYDGLHLACDKIRPDQVSWHTRFNVAGGQSWFYIGAMYQGQLHRFLTTAGDAIARRGIGWRRNDSIYKLYTTLGTSRNDPLFTESVRYIINGKY